MVQIPSLGAATDDADPQHLSRPVDLVIREAWEFGGAIAAAVLGVPCVLHGIGPVTNVEEVLTIAGGRWSWA